MKKFWLVLAVVAVAAVAMVAWLNAFVRGIERAEPAVASQTCLRWRVQSAYPEDRDPSALALILEGRRPTMRDVVFALARAGRDSRVQGLLLDVRGLSVDWAKAQELHEAVRAFARGGKPVLAYVESGGEKEYLLAAAADRVALAPEGNLFLLGVSAEMSFLKGTLDKLGMQADFVHVGRYKSAPEQLTRADPTEPHRQMIEAIVDDHYRRLVRAIAQRRGADEARAARWIDAGVYDGPGALAAGLVDTLGTLADLEEEFAGDARVMDLEDYAVTRRTGRAAGTIALIHVTGTIVPGESDWDDWTGRRTGSDTVVEQLARAREDDGVQAVILRVDSPGGSATASDVIWAEVARTRESKPVIVSMSGYAASGGYYVSCGADSIFAEPGTLTGSIGVFAGKVDMSGFYAKLGISREFVVRGENALLLGNQAVFTPAQRAALEAQLGAFYGRFVAKVAAGRGLTAGEVAAVAEGRVWTGEQAVAHRLVDGLGGLQRALDAAKRRLGLGTDELVAIVTYEEPLTLLERMLLRTLHRREAGVFAGRAGPGWAGPAAPLLAELARDGTLAAAPLLDGRPLALLPWRLDLR
jgi:protease-4